MFHGLLWGWRGLGQIRSWEELLRQVVLGEVRTGAGMVLDRMVDGWG